MLSEAHKDKILCNIFVDNEPKVNIFMSKGEREQFAKTVRKPRPQQQQQTMSFPHPMMMQQNFYGMAPYGMMPPMGNMPMGNIPPMGGMPMGGAPGLLSPNMPGFAPQMPMPVSRR